MKIIEVDEELYQFIASQTQSIGESASDILRRLLNLPSSSFALQNFDSDKLASAKNGFDGAKTGGQNLESFSEPSPVKKAKKNTQTISVKADNAETKITEIVKKLEQLILSAEFQNENKMVGRFLSVLSQLYQLAPAKFAETIDQEMVQGRTRTYFAQDEQTLLNAGNHTKPKQIPNSPYWVITNNNSGRKMLMLARVMEGMALPADLIEKLRPYFVS